MKKPYDKKVSHYNAKPFQKPDKKIKAKKVAPKPPVEPPPPPEDGPDGFVAYANPLFLAEDWKKYYEYFSEVNNFWPTVPTGTGKIVNFDVDTESLEQGGYSKASRS